jgi:hypothetical protein
MAVGFSGGSPIPSTISGHETESQLPTATDPEGGSKTGGEGTWVATTEYDLETAPEGIHPSSKHATERKTVDLRSKVLDRGSMTGL